MRSVLYTGDTPRDVEDFPAGTVRSVEGSLRLLPGQPREVTLSECVHLASIFGDRLRVLPEHVATTSPEPAPAPVDPPARRQEAPVRADESGTPKRRAGGSATRSTRNRK